MIRKIARPAPALSFPRLAAAAALFLTLGVALLAVGSEAPVLTARADHALSSREALREHYASRVLLLDDSSRPLSPAARQLAGTFGASLSGGAGQ